jgi:hypothetical protein
LEADLDDRLRTMIRRLQRDADEAIDRTDPAQAWGELEPWLNRRIMSDVMAAYSMLEEQVAVIGADVAELFRLDEDEVATPLNIDVTASSLELSPFGGALDLESSNVGADALTTLRGLEEGVVLFGAVAQLAGLALTGPAGFVIGLVMGGKSLRDERKRQLTLRRQQAKAAVSDLLDEVRVLVGEDTQKWLRHAQRRLRDGLTERARILGRSTEDALVAAEEAAGTDKASRERRLTAVEEELAHLEELRAQISALAPR